MTIEQDIENYLKHYEAYGNEPLCLISPLRSMYPWLRHQQSIIKNQAEEITELKRQLESLRSGVGEE